MAIRMLKCLVGLAYECVVSEESVPGGLGTAQFQHMCTPISAKIINNSMECVQAFHDISTCITAQVI